MASNSLGSLTLDLVAKTAPFSKGMKKAEKDLTAFGVKAGQAKKQSQGISRGLTTLSAGFVGVGVAAGAAAAKIAQFGIESAVAWTAFSVKAAADAESVKTSFETILGSAEEANNMVDRLMDFSKRTPFEPDELFAGGRQLLAGGFGIDQTMQDLQTLGDIAAGSQSDLNELVRAFAQVGATGRVELGDVNKFADRGIPIYKALAEQMGVGKNELRDLVSSGKVGFEDLRTALEGLTESGGIFANAMAKQSETLNGLWSTLTGNIKAGAAEFGNAFTQGTNLTGVLKEMNTALEGMKWEEMGQSAADAFKLLLTGSKMTLTAIQAASKAMTTAFDVMFQGIRGAGVFTELAGQVTGNEEMQRRGRRVKGDADYVRKQLQERDERFDKIMKDLQVAAEKFERAASRGGIRERERETEQDRLAKEAEKLEKERVKAVQAMPFNMAKMFAGRVAGAATRVAGGVARPFVSGAMEESGRLRGTDQRLDKLIEATRQGLRGVREAIDEQTRNQPRPANI